MLQEASNGVLWNVLRGRFAAPQDEGLLGQALSRLRAQACDFFGNRHALGGRRAIERMLAGSQLLQYRSHEGFSAAAANASALSREGEDDG